MIVTEFVGKVGKMRQAQKEYFKNRLQKDLILSKQLEREIDKALVEGMTLYESGWKPSDEYEQMALSEPDAADLLDEDGKKGDHR